MKLKQWDIDRIKDYLTFCNEQTALQIQKDYVEIYGFTERESEKAILFGVGNENAVWVPKSQMISWPEQGELGEAVMKEWIAKEKELI